MLMSILILNFLLSLVFIFLKHPLSLGCILLVQTILVSLASSFFHFNSWFNYIFFLIMIGGMLIMFIYMTSIASNEKFLMPKILVLPSMTIVLLIIFMLNYKDNFYSNLINLMTNSMSFYNKMTNLSMNKFFNHPNMFILISLMIYLLITLIAIVKITGKNTGPLRQK